MSKWSSTVRFTFALVVFGVVETTSRIAERISFDKVAEAHRRLEAGGLDGKLVLYPDLPSMQPRAAAA